MRKFLAVWTVLAICGVVALAQEPKNELAGTVGRMFISDQTPPNTNFFDNTLHFGKGTSFEIDYARRLRSYGWETYRSKCRQFLIRTKTSTMGRM
jgi:hypothetical protein